MGQRGMLANVSAGVGERSSTPADPSTDLARRDRKARQFKGWKFGSGGDGRHLHDCAAAIGSRLFMAISVL